MLPILFQALVLAGLIGQVVVAILTIQWVSSFFLVYLLVSCFRRTQQFGELEADGHVRLDCLLAVAGDPGDNLLLPVLGLLLLPGK